MQETIFNIAYWRRYSFAVKTKRAATIETFLLLILLSSKEATMASIVLNMILSYILFILPKVKIVSDL
ncbi:MAG: hypothetical protein ABIS01_10345 [Ferruginibacter sp.]